MDRGISCSNSLRTGCGISILNSEFYQSRVTTTCWTSLAFEGSKDFLYMSIDLHFRENFLDKPVFADDEGRPFDAHHLFPVHTLLFVDAVRSCNFFSGVGQQRHVQMMFIAEPGLLWNVIGAYPDRNRSSPFCLSLRIPEPGCLTGSTRRVGLGIEKQNHVLLSGIVAEADLSSMVVLQRESGRPAAFFQHIPP